MARTCAQLEKEESRCIVQRQSEASKGDVRIETQAREKGPKRVQTEPMDAIHQKVQR